MIVLDIRQNEVRPPHLSHCSINVPPVHEVVGVWRRRETLALAVSHGHSAGRRDGTIGARSPEDIVGSGVGLLQAESEEPRLLCGFNHCREFTILVFDGGFRNW